MSLGSSLRVPRDEMEEGVDVLGYQITKVALAGDALGAGGDLELVAIQINHVVLGHVVAGRVVELRAHHFGSGRKLRVADRVEAQQVEGAGRIGDQDPRPAAMLLDGQHLPGGVDHRWPAFARACHQLFEGHAMAAVAVGEPWAVGNFPERVRVAGRYDAGLRLPFSRRQELIGEVLENVAQRAALGVDRVARRRFLPDRIIRVKLLRRCRLAPQ